MSEMTKGKHLELSLRRRPKSYAMTEQQQQMREVAEICGIKKGITRDELIDKMINCVPEAWEKLKEES